MKNVKTILQMFLIENQSIRKIATISGMPYSTVYDNITCAVDKKLTWPQVEALSEEELESMLSAKEVQRPLPDWGYIEKELKRHGVTLQLLWQEYKEAHPKGYQYSRFCEIFDTWREKNDIYTPIPHKAGEELFVDYSGDKLSFICHEANRAVEAEIFVAVLGASDFIYCEASLSQQLPCWVDSNINAFEYNGGVTQYVVPDNLKSAITTPDRYEASINRSYEEMGKHYSTFVIPARSRKPKDKSKVEKAVQIVQREILAPLRKYTFFSLSAMNQSIWEKLEQVNARPFQKRAGSRKSAFEEIDKPALKPLPETRYRYREWLTKLKVGQNHHVLIGEHNYSAPYQYARAEVEATSDNKIVEIFHKGLLIAKHRRSFVIGGTTTLREHMPPKYQHYFDSYDKEKLLNRAKEMGPNVLSWVEVVFSLKARPPKTLFHSVLGVLSLVKEFEKERIDAVCVRALAMNIHSYLALKSMLAKGADHLPMPSEGTIQSHLPQHHANVRGAEHFA